MEINSSGPFVHGLVGKIISLRFFFDMFWKWQEVDANSVTYITIQRNRFLVIMQL